MSKFGCSSGDPIILIRRQFQQLFIHSNNAEPLRNQLFIDLPTQMGLRTGEMTLLKWEGVDTRKGRLTITDSKKKKDYPLPMNFEIAEKLERYREGHKRGWVFRRLEGVRGGSYKYVKKGQPLHPTSIWKMWKKIARRAGLEKPELYNPRLGRHYFAAMFAKRGGNLEVLRRILRHTNLQRTQIYVSRLTFYEDVKEEYDRIQELPVTQRRHPSVNAVRGGPATSSPVYKEFCYECQHFPVCGFKEQMAQSDFADSCKYFRPSQPDIPIFAEKPRRR